MTPNTLTQTWQSVRGKRVLVTGHTGFKGSWLSLWLKHLGAQVYGLALAPHTTPNNFTASQVQPGLAGHIEADIRDLSALERALTEIQPEVIFHLAAQALVRESYTTPRETFETNAMGTVNLLEAVRKYAVHRRGESHGCVVIVITSDKCYENREQVWGYREEDAMGGHDPYSASKGVAELIVSSYRRSFFNPAKIKDHGIKLASARAGNVIGGGDWAADRIVVDAVTHLSKNLPVPVRNPHAIRPWQHVLEPLSGYLHLAATLLDTPDSAALQKLCSGWNFGPRSGDEATVEELVTRLCQVWGQGASWQDLSNPHALHEAGILRLSIDKATWQLKWKPRWNLEQTIERTANWYRHYYATSQPHMQAACVSDIEAYMSAESTL